MSWSHPLDPADAVEGRETQADVRAALDTLRESDRELITLVHWEAAPTSDKVPGIIEAGRRIVLQVSSAAQPVTPPRHDAGDQFAETANE